MSKFSWCLAFISMSILFFSTTINQASARLISECGPNQQNEILAAKKFLQQNIQEILSDEQVPTFSWSYNWRLKRKVFTVNVICSDSRDICSDNYNVYTLAAEGDFFRKKIEICYNKIKSIYQNRSFCKLAGTILHEIGHSARIKIPANHNDGPNADSVYLLGDAAFKKCLQLGLDHEI
ncbi:MAG: hypothetical protein HQK51_15410 [Oligoflexia bacterium]|nr:hypothetical protein [Oligoflexia bacterium]